MSIRKIIREQVSTFLKEYDNYNYPAGADADPNAPWNQVDPPDYEDFEIIDDSNDTDSFVVKLKDAAGGSALATLSEMLKKTKAAPEVVQYFEQTLLMEPRPEDFINKLDDLANDYSAYAEFDDYPEPPERDYDIEDEMIDESNESIGSENPLNGKSKESVKRIIYKLYHQIDHGQRYSDKSWENVHKIFDLFGQNNIETTGPYNAEYNPGGMHVDAMTPQWKKWLLDFNFIDNKGVSRTLTYVLTAHAAGSVQDVWDSYDITFYPVN